MTAEPSHRFTRRQTLKSLAVVSASFWATGLVGVPRPRIPAVTARETHLSQGEVGPGWARQVPTGLAAQMVGFEWAGRVPGALQVRAREATGWSPWLEVEANLDEGPDPASHERRTHTAAGPVWVGHDIGEVEVRVAHGRMRDVRMHAIRSEDPPAAPFGPDVAGAASQPGMTSRRQWGADESWRTVAPGCNGHPEYASALRNAFVHHTVNSNSYGPGDSAAMVRGIYHFHTHTNKWCDIGYNFLVDRYGQIFEGRAGGIDRAVIGAHAGGFNSGSTGAALLGTFQDVVPPGEMYNALVTLLGWKLELHGVRADGTVTVTSAGSSRYPSGTKVTLHTISGHRDVSATQCPGDQVYLRLPQLRSDVQRHIGQTSHRLDVFVRGTDNRLYQRSWDGSRWLPYAGLGGVLSSDPAAVSWGRGRIDVFVRGTDDHLHHRAFAGGRWHDWRSLGGVLTSAPDVASWGPGRLDVFVRGTDNRLYQRTFDGTRWLPWSPLPGVVGSDPAAVSWGPGRIDVFARSTDGQLIHKPFAGGRWHDWIRLGGALTSAPDVASWGTKRLDVFARGTDNRLWQRTFDGTGWLPWSGLAGVVDSSPGAVSWGPGRIDVFARGTDRQLIHKAFAGGRWHDWRRLGGALTSGPDAASWG